MELSESYIRLRRRSISTVPIRIHKIFRIIHKLATFTFIVLFLPRFTTCLYVLLHRQNASPNDVRKRLSKAPKWLLTLSKLALQTLLPLKSCSFSHLSQLASQESVSSPSLRADYPFPVTTSKQISFTRKIKIKK